MFLFTLGGVRINLDEIINQIVLKINEKQSLDLLFIKNYDKQVKMNCWVKYIDSLTDFWSITSYDEFFDSRQNEKDRLKWADGLLNLSLLKIQYRLLIVGGGMTLCITKQKIEHFLSYEAALWMKKFNFSNCYIDMFISEKGLNPSF